MRLPFCWTTIASARGRSIQVNQTDETNWAEAGTGEPPRALPPASSFASGCSVPLQFASARRFYVRLVRVRSITRSPQTSAAIDFVQLRAGAIAAAAADWTTCALRVQFVRFELH